MGFFDPLKQDSKDPVYFLDVYAIFNAVDATRNTVTLTIPPGWISSENELTFGVRVGGGIAIDIDSNITVTATLNSGRQVEVYKWGPAKV